MSMIRKTSELEVWDRKAGKIILEEVYGEAFVQFLYQNAIGSFLERAIFSRKFFSELMGVYFSSRLSARKIKAFIKKYNVALHEFEKAEYKNFNDFFVRRFLPESRPFAKGELLPAFAEGRYLGYQQASQLIRVKNQDLSLQNVLGKALEKYPGLQEGPFLIARLCPVDYHRFHFFDDSYVLDRFSIPGSYHSVNPWALRKKTFAQNERVVTVLQTNHFGKVAYVPVGALGVGKIVLSHPVFSSELTTMSCKRGEEMGYFLFGGSTVLLFGEKGSWKIDADILQNTAQGVETLIRLGEPVAKSQ